MIVIAMTSTEAAAALGLSPRTVRRRAAHGRFHGAERAGRDWFIPSDAVQAEKARRERPKEASA